MTEAAFRATYAEWKVIKTRATVQLVFEIPIEQADAAYQALGGMPIAAKEVWCGIARLAKPADEQTVSPSRPLRAGDKPGSATRPPAQPIRAEKEKRKFDQIAPAAQAGILCGEQAFSVFLAEKFPQIWTITNRDPAAAVREICEVDSRREIKPDNALWSALVVSYWLWRHEPEFVGAA